MIIEKSNPNAEMRVLTCLLMIGNCDSIHVKKAMLQLDELCFYNIYLRDLFNLIKKQYDSRLIFDTPMILDLTRSYSDKHHQWLDRIMFNDTHSLANFEAYIDELILVKILREQMKTAQRMLGTCKVTANNHESAHILQQGIRDLTSIGLNKTKEGRTLDEIGERYFSGQYDNEKITTHIPEIDEQNDGGIQNSCLITVCGDTGVGKTYFALNLMYKIGNYNSDKQSLYFNLEMSEQFNWERIIAIQASKPFIDLTLEEKIQAHRRVKQHPITIYEEKYSDIDEIMTIARVKALEKPLSVVVIDYITLVTCKNDYHRNDLEQVSIAKRLASLAIELKCIVIATSQTNRNPQSRSKDDRCPYMSDAADSSGNYKSAEIWIGIDRPELYNENPVFENKFIAKVRKNRNGRLFNMVWDFNVGTFGSINQKNFFYQVEMQSGFHEQKKKNIFESFTERLDRF